MRHRFEKTDSKFVTQISTFLNYKTESTGVFFIILQNLLTKIGIKMSHGQKTEYQNISRENN